MYLHYKARESGTTQFVDIMSLYPYICKYFKFPVGHLIIHVGDACKDIEAYLSMNGLMKFSIVPRDRLYHSVLPFRCKKKLMFLPCRMCVLTSSSAECVHTRDENRALTGTWVMDEFKLAVETVTGYSR